MEKLKFVLPESTETAFISMDGQSQWRAPSCGQDTPRYLEGWERPCALGTTEAEMDETCFKTLLNGARITPAHSLELAEFYLRPLRCRYCALHRWETASGRDEVTGPRSQVAEGRARSHPRSLIKAVMWFPRLFSRNARSNCSHQMPFFLSLTIPQWSFQDLNAVWWPHLAPMAHGRCAYVFLRFKHCFNF